MKAEKTERGFVEITHPAYLEDRHGSPRIVSESSVILDYPDSWEKPGSSALWVGEHHHLGREEVRELVARLQHWLDTGRLKADE